MFIAVIIILLSGDIELNSGPKQTRLRYNREQKEQTQGDFSSQNFIKQVLEKIDKLDHLEEMNQKLDSLLLDVEEVRETQEALQQENSPKCDYLEA